MRPPDPPNGNVWSRALFSARSRVHRLPAGEAVWRVAIGLIGLVIVVVGVILLPLPGPGWLIIFVGIGAWATEFAWASRLLTRTRTLVSRWTSWVSALPRWRQHLAGANWSSVSQIRTPGRLSRRRLGPWRGFPPDPASLPSFRAEVSDRLRARTAVVDVLARIAVPITTRVAQISRGRPARLPRTTESGEIR